MAEKKRGRGYQVIRLDGGRWIPARVSMAVRRTLASPLPLALLGFGFFALYLATLTKWYTFDSVSYAENIRLYEETGKPGLLLHPHHLAFNAAGYLMHQAILPVIPSATTLLALQVFTALMGAIGLVAFAAWLREELGAPGPALLGAMALGFSFGWWFTSTDGRAIAAAAAMVFVALWALGRAGRRASTGFAVAGGVALGTACLLHEAHVLFVPVAVCILLLGRNPKGSRFRRVAAFLLALGLSVAIPYAVAVFGLLGLRSRPEIASWLLSYARQDTWWSLHPVQNLPLDLQALSRVLTGQESAMVRWKNDGVLTWGEAALFLWAALALPALRPSVWRRRWRFWPPLLLAFLLYGAFFTVWNPGWFVFWTLPGGMLIALCAVAWSRNRGAFATGARFALILALGLVTWAGAIREKTDAHANTSLGMAQALRSLEAPGAMIVVSGLGDIAYEEVYLPYFARLQVLALHAAWDRTGHSSGPAEAMVRDAIERKMDRGAPVYLAREAITSQSGLEEMRRRYGVPPEAIRGIFAPYRLEPALRYDHHVIYRLERRAQSRSETASLKTGSSRTAHSIDP